MATDRTYHHGDLRAALLTQALEVVESQGYEAVSLRALAEKLGVSRGAPYRHFPERDHLLAELAATGFQQLDRFASNFSEKDADPVSRLVTAAHQFLEFVDQHPQLFKLIYESGLLQRAADFPQLAHAQAGVYEKIFALYTSAAATRPTPCSDDVRALVIAFWSTIFGYAKLRQAALLQPYMKGELGEAEIRAQVIRTAIGPGLLSLDQD